MRKTLLFSLIALILSSYSVMYAAHTREKNSKQQDLPDVVLLGDSNTWIGGDDCSHPRGWNYWFAQDFPHRSIRSYARSGATRTHTSATSRDVKDYTERLSDQNVVYNQVERLIAAHQLGQQPTPSLIIIAAGTNDAWFNKARPQALHNDVVATFSISKRASRNIPIGQWQTLARAIRNNCLLLQRAFPKAHIVLLSPLQSTAFPAERLHTATQIMSQTAKHLHLPLVRQDSLCCLRAENERKVHKYSTDGTHTSVEGARLNGKILANTIGKLW